MNDAIITDYLESLDREGGKGTVNTKPSNPKDAIGIKKPPQSVLPQNVMAEVGVAMLEGALKYGRHNFRVIGVRGSVYYDAARRHIDSWWEGEDIDPDSELNHITKAITSLVVLRDAMLNDKWTDDRPPKSDVAGHRERMETAVRRLFEKYPEAKEAYTELGESLIRPWIVEADVDTRI